MWRDIKVYPVSFTKAFEEFFGIPNVEQLDDLINVPKTKFQSVSYKQDEKSVEVRIGLLGKEQDDIDVKIDSNGAGVVNNKKDGEVLARFKLSNYYNLAKADAKMRGGLLTVRASRKKDQDKDFRRIPVSS